MPLSEHEENQLRQIAEQFYTDDPALAGKLGVPSMSRTVKARTSYGVFLLLVGLAGLILAVSLPNPLIGVGAFLAMLAGSILIYNTVKTLRIGTDTFPDLHLTR